MFRIFTAVGGIFVIISGFYHAAQAEDFPVRRDVALKVGDSIVLRGLRSSCGSEQSSLETVRTFDTGRVVVGSRRCGGRASMPQTVFFAERPGTEVITLRQDVVNVTVTE